jgi:hypothetical protein
MKISCAKWSSKDGMTYSEAKRNLSWFLGYIVASAGVKNIAPEGIDDFFDSVALDAKKHLPKYIAYRQAAKLAAREQSAAAVVEERAAA